MKQGRVEELVEEVVAGREGASRRPSGSSKPQGHLTLQSPRVTGGVRLFQWCCDLCIETVCYAVAARRSVAAALLQRVSGAPTVR